MSAVDPKYEEHPHFKNRSWCHQYPYFAYTAFQGAEFHYKSMIEIFNRSFITANPQSNPVIGTDSDKFTSE